MKLIMKESVLNDLIQQASEGLPNEICGYLVGKKYESVLEVYYREPLFNVDQSPVHFSMKPSEQFEAFQKASEKDFVFISCYHSHPETKARPSYEDLKLASDPNLIYTIISLENKMKPDVRCYTIYSEDINIDENDDVVESGEMENIVFQEKIVTLHLSNLNIYRKFYIKQIDLEIQK